MKRFLLAALAVFFMSASMAQGGQSPTPNPDCFTIDDTLKEHKKQNLPMPVERIPLQGSGNTTLMVYPSGEGVLVSSDENGCTMAAVYKTPEQVRKILDAQPPKPASMAQELPKPKPAEKSAPACNTISKFFGDVEYIARSHRNFIDLRFAFVPKDTVIVAFHIVGPCIQGNAIIIRRDHPYFPKLYQMIFAGWDA